MKAINELQKSLSVHLPWHKSRLNCLTRMILAMIAVRTVNLVDLACAFGGGKVKALSHYRRLQRFFSSFEIHYSQIASLVFGLFARGEKVYLSMDRTQWQWGQAPINILMLSLVYKGTAIPIYWSMIPHKGNSNTKRRIALMNRFIKHFGHGCIAGLLCDREFVGEEWFRYLKNAEIAFYICVKNNTVTTNKQGKSVDLWTQFMGLNYREQRVLKGRRRIYGIKVHLVGVRCDDGEQLIVATSEKPVNVIETYRLRWEIETLFGCLKSRGFRFEDTHITKPERINKLVAVLTIAFAWAHRIGEWRHEEKEPIKIKTHGRLAKSLFRHGLDFVRRLLFFGQFCLKTFRLCLGPLSTDKSGQPRMVFNF
jgi:hypothetical protein